MTTAMWFLSPSGFNLLTGLFSTIALLKERKDDIIMINRDKKPRKNFLYGDAFSTVALFGNFTGKRFKNNSGSN